MPMPSTSLTFGDKFLIQIVSAILFLISNLWYGHKRIRSIGISNFPLSFALFCKCARPFASNEKRSKLLEERKKHDTKSDDGEDSDPLDIDPLDDPAFIRNCLLWSIMQFLCVTSGIFNWYPDVIIKGAVVFHILLTVQDSIKTRPIKLHEEELRLKRKQKLQLESAQFWKFFLPKAIWKLLGFEKVVKEATAAPPNSILASSDKNNDGDDNNDLKKKEELIKKVHTAKNVVRGKRETAVDDLIWGAIQIAYVAFDVTHKQAIGTAFMVYLCTLLEDVLVISNSSSTDDSGDDGKGSQQKTKKKINWFKISWIVICVYFTGRWFFS